VHCIACSWLTEKVLLERQHAKFAELNLGSSVIEIVFNPAEVRLSALARALDRVGYTPHPILEKSESALRRRETRSLLARLGIAAASAGNIMLLAVSQYAGDVTGIEAGYSTLFRWVSFGLALPAVIYSAYPYYRGAWSGLRRGMLHMDLPISLGIIATFSISAVATLRNSGAVYFDSVSMLIFLLLTGRLVLQRAGRWAADASETLLGLTPRVARRIEGSATCEILLNDVHVGDRLRVLPGEIVPVDGQLDSADGWVSESHLTGEPGAAHRMNGEMLYAGSNVERSPIEITASAVGELTKLSRLGELMRFASSRRAPVVGVMDRIAGYFVGGVLMLAACTIILWLFIDPSRALWNAAALLVVACPCALGLATPVALATAMGRAARRGIFIRSQDGVERLASVNYVILDKTGTLTEGNLGIVRAHFAEELSDSDRNEILHAVAALEKYSGHAIAGAFAESETFGVIIENCRVIPGAGIEGIVNGESFVIGSEGFVADRSSFISPLIARAAREDAAAGLTLAWVARGRKVVAIYSLGDRLRSDSATALSDLRNIGMNLEILSGDQPQSVRNAAEQLNVNVWRGRAMPEDKVKRVEELLAADKKVAMVGDGVNDAAALSLATVGISAAGSAEVARDAADVFVSETRGVSAIAESFKLSRRAMRVIRANLAVAVAYNLVGATLAMSGLVGPLAAAILMPVSSLTVLLIASRA